MQDAQVYQDYQEHTRFKFHTECRRGIQVSRRVVKPHRKCPVLHTCNITSSCFSHQLQAIKWSVVIRSIAVKPPVAKGLTYYWVMSDFIFTHLLKKKNFFKFSCSNASSPNALYSCHLWKKAREHLEKVAKECINSFKTASVEEWIELLVSVFETQTSCLFVFYMWMYNVYFA